MIKKVMKLTKTQMKLVREGQKNDVHGHVFYVQTGFRRKYSYGNRDHDAAVGLVNAGLAKHVRSTKGSVYRRGIGEHWTDHLFMLTDEGLKVKS